MHKHTLSNSPVKFGTKSNVSTGALIARDGWMCAYCGKFLTLDLMTVDHVVPTLRGGSDTLDNTVISCRACNASKGDMTAKEYNHWLAVCRYAYDIAPNEVIEQKPIMLTTAGNMTSIIGLPALWAGVQTLDKRWVNRWSLYGVLVVRLNYRDPMDIAVFGGVLYDYYTMRGFGLRDTAA